MSTALSPPTVSPSRRLSRAEVAVDRSVWIATWATTWLFFVVQLAVVIDGDSSPLQLAITALVGLYALVLMRIEPPAIDSTANHVVLALISLGVLVTLASAGGPTGLIGAIFLGALIAVRLDDRRLVAAHLLVFVVGAVVLGGLAASELLAVTTPAMGLTMLLLSVCVPVLAFSCMVTLEAAEAQGDELERLVRRDALTGVGNRRLMLEELESELARHERQGKSLSIVLIDLNAFKRLNDEHGHAAGDEVLRDVATALGGVLGARDTLTRLGGDEFCVILPETDDHVVPRTVNAIRAALASVETPTGRGVTAGTGAATYPADAVNVDVLLHVADERLRENKPASRRGREPSSHTPERRASDRRRPQR